MNDYHRWLKRLVSVARKQGWSVEQNRHVKLTSPEGRVVCCSVSPRNGTQVRLSVMRDLTRVGFDTTTL